MGVCGIDHELAFAISRYIVTTTVTFTNVVLIERISKMKEHKNLKKLNII